MGEIIQASQGNIDLATEMQNNSEAIKNEIKNISNLFNDFDGWKGQDADSFKNKLNGFCNRASDLSNNINEVLVKYKKEQENIINLTPKIDENGYVTKGQVDLINKLINNSPQANGLDQQKFNDYLWNKKERETGMLNGEKPIKYKEGEKEEFDKYLESEAYREYFAASEKIKNDPSIPKENIIDKNGIKRKLTIDSSGEGNVRYSIK